jgi:hypothetical protein
MSVLFQEASTWFSVVAILVGMLGWVYQLGVQHARISQISDGLKLVELRMLAHHERTDIHVTEEWRRELRDLLVRLERKLDDLQKGTK